LMPLKKDWLEKSYDPSRVKLPSLWSFSNASLNDEL